MTDVTTAELTLRGVSLAFGGLQALDHVDLDVKAGAITSLIGPNGAGKTTLFNVIAGVLRVDEGHVLLRGTPITSMPPHQRARLGVARTFQDLRLFKQMTALENVLMAVPKVVDDLPRALFSRRMLRPSAVRAAESALELLDIRQYADERAGSLSYGLQKRLAIARAIATDAQLLLLDEPTSGLHPSLVDRLLDLIRTLVADGRTIVLIDHNMEAVMDTSHHVVVLDHGRKIAEGLPSDIRRDEQVLAVYLGIA